MNSILSVRDLEQLLNLSRSTIWRMRHQGILPAPLYVSTNRIGWLSTEIEEWLKARSRA